ncbi:InlB B-repeat-containing protein [[Ruminococcus] lactaris]|uniref:InlB B-repeat-containing protein n=3 Tax=Clostridia TaxID=186801 RepID=UPI00242CA79C|nr:InlB B-repeat-containing protein [[Ruminococcus] lactaris]
MKKRILSILLLCCMVLTLLPTTAFAAETGAMDNIPAKFDVEIDLCNRTSDINIKDSKTYYIYSSSSDPDFVWTKKIQINGKKAAPHIFLDNVNIQVNKDAKTPAIELHGKASAYLYFINRDSKLTGATGRAAIQKNRSEGQLCVQVMEGTTVTCQGGYKAAGIGGSWATRNIAESLFNLDMYGHGANMHFGSQTNPSLWSGTIIAKGGDGGAGIGGGRNGSGEKLYFYSGKIEAKGGEAGSGIGGSFKGRGRDIYIYGGDISATGGDGGAGIGGGCWKSLQDMDGDTAAYNINIYGGKINAHGGYNGAGIGGGQFVPARDITITGGEITAHGTHGAAIGGGRWCHGQNITVTDAKLKLTTGYSRYISDEAAAMGYGDCVYLEKVYDIDVGKRYIGDLVRNPLPEDYKSIKIGSYHGKLVKLKVEAQAINRDDEFALFWNLYDILIPNENGRIDVQLLTLPYVKNYGWAIEAMEMELIDDPCNGKHDFGWVNRQSCHVWACRNMKCQARDPVAPESASNGKHASSGWNTEKHQLLCDVCGHVMETDTKAPVLEVLKDGESYTVEDNINGNPGAYTFTVSDPALDGEASSGIKSVTINGEPQAGPTYRLPAPDGGNNDAGAEYTVVATDNAGNETTATVRTYRRHHVKVISPDGKKTYADLMLPHNEYLVLQIRLPAGVSATLTDEADGTKIPYDKEKGEFRVGLITKNRTLVLNYSTKHPKVELRLGTGQYFTGYNADSDEPYYLKGASMDGNSYQIGMWVDTDAKPGYYLSSPNRYTQEELAALDESLWKEYKIAEATPGSIVLPFILITIDAAAYEKNGGWYVYAKATNPTGTTFVSTPNIIIDVENPKAIDLSTGKELENYGKYYGNLRFKVEDSSPVTVRCHTSPSGKAELLTPDENGVYTIPAEYDNSIQHTLIIEDACGNVASYKSFRVFWNYLTNVREKDHWDVAPAQPIRISREQDLKEELSKVQIGVFAADTSGFIPVEVSWEIPADYDPQSQREQTFTVNGTVILEGTGARCNSGLDVITRPGEEWKKNISVQVTVEGDPQYKVTVQDCENGRVKVVNAAGTAEDGTPLFFKGELVMLSIDPDEGYMLSTLSVNGNPAAVAVGDDTYTFTQPEGDVTITAAFEMRNEHTVTFDANGGSEPEELPEEVTTAMPAKKILHGSEYSLPECEFIAPEGKQFKAWEIGGTEYPVNAPVTVTADITVKALWKDAPPAHAEYTVRFNANGGGGTMADVTGVSGSYTLPSCGFTEPEGKQFKGWSTSADGSVISGTTYEVSSDTTFYAIWESKEYSIIVTDGKATIGAGSEISKAAQGTTITLTANAAPDGKVFDKWVVESGNTTLEDANSETTTFIMPDSEVSVKATYTIPHTHTYDQEIQKPETLKSAADCTNDAVYFKSCSCGEISTTETFTAAGTQLGHAWASDWSKDTDNHWKECSRCHEKKDEAAHDYGSDNICDTCGYDKTVPHTHNLTLVPAKAPTCTEKGNTAYYTCDGCDKWFEDATGASEITDKTSVILAATGHSASDWKSDNTDHWKECTVVGCGVIIEGSKAAHTAGEWIIDTPATATTSGSKHKECTVCGYTMATETIPATGGGEHTHSYGSEWKNDADNHWHECSCGDKKDTAAHTAGEWIIDTPATATTDGSKHKECTVCGYTMATETIPATGGGEHTHSYGSEWKNDADNHWHECSCGDKKDTAAHTAGEWIIDTPATATTDGSKHKECTVCGYTMTIETIPATGGGEHTHSYGSEWKNDATNHWHECSCGDKADVAAHTASDWIIDTPATATTSGSKHKECTVCGYTMATETIPTTGGGEHTHSYGSEWKYDADNHWHECSCGDNTDKAAHDFKWVVDKEATATQKGSKHEKCKVCGYKKDAVEIPATGTPTEPGKPTGPDSPQTGDNSNMMLWFAVLFVSGFGVLGTVIYGKKKKEQAE